MVPAAPRTEILVDSQPGLTRAAVLEDGRVVDLLVEPEDADRVAGRIYKGRVRDVLPGMAAAFVDIGLARNAFLSIGDAAAGAFDVEAPQPARPSVDDGVRPGQDVVVQVSKEPTGGKGARVTRNITLPGRYLVLLPGADYVGVSRRIESGRERERLRAAARRLQPQGAGLIVRTVAEGADEAELAADAANLNRLWAAIEQRARAVEAPALLFRDVGLGERAARDFLSEAVDALIVDGAPLHRQVVEFVDLVMPALRAKVRLHPPGGMGLFEQRGVEAEIERALRRRVWLPSGGYLVFDRTEALTVVDVNTGRFVGRDDLAETVYRTNLEAAREIARQLRLRDIGGIVLIDFIHMDSAAHREGVRAELAAAVRGDRTRVAIAGVTPLGLVELTRRRPRQSLDEVLLRPCPECDGRGRVSHQAAVAGRMRAEVVAAARSAPGEACLIELHPLVAGQLIGSSGAGLTGLEREAGKAIYLRGRGGLGVRELRVARSGSRAEVESAALPVSPGDVLQVRIEEAHENRPGNGIARLDGYVIDVAGAGELVGRQVEVQVRRAYRTYARAELTSHLRK